MSSFGPPLNPLEVFGLWPLHQALKDTIKALAGSGNVKPTRFDHTSLRVFKPHIGLPLWLGRRRPDGLTMIYNFFNRNPAPKDEGYSVRVTHCRDFMGGQNTYDGHLGTDFAVPVGTPVTAPAAGKVVKVVNYFDRGGLKIVMDHGGGLMTNHNHLARVLVEEGDVVGRGAVVALSGASSLDFVVFFPWTAPHLHFNVWLNSTPVDPFAILEEGETPLWRTSDNRPLPVQEMPDSLAEYEPTQWEEALVMTAVQDCFDEAERARLLAIEPLEARAVETVISRNYRPYLYREFPAIYASPAPRQPRLDLPFRPQDVGGVAFPGE